MRETDMDGWMDGWMEGGRESDAQRPADKRRHVPASCPVAEQHEAVDTESGTKYRNTAIAAPQNHHENHTAPWNSLNNSSNHINNNRPQMI